MKLAVAGCGVDELQQHDSIAFTFEFEFDNERLISGAIGRI